MNNTEKNNLTYPLADSGAQCGVSPLPSFTKYGNNKNALSSKLISANTLVMVGTLLLLLAAVITAFGLHPNFKQLHFDRISTPWGISLTAVAATLLILKLGFLGYILYLYFRYKPVASVSDEALPTCTVIVPAYNEGELVYQTLLSLADSDYPQEKLQIIAIDDGSKDDTWSWIRRAKLVIGSRLTILQQPKNMGKRHALDRGFRMGEGEIFITVDSDSVVKRDTLRLMASPFVVDDNCGAVAGNVRVLNKDKGMIPKMLNVSFAFSFEFIRSAQSTLGSVLCTPGALSAYRKKAVMNCLDEWLNQHFMGTPSNIGEDRAMTNMILKQGYFVRFQKDAMVYTNIPENYKTLKKMFIRWERSNVRENIMMSKFAFSNFREGKKLGTRVLLINQWLKMLMAYPAVVGMIVLFVLHPVMFITSTLIGILIFSSIQTYFYARKKNLWEALWAYPYSIFYAFTLFWITPYAIATAGRSGWLTRG